ncbi:hypothetical protein ACLKA7_015117 [Drosophila subpalustris]
MNSRFFYLLLMLSGLFLSKIEDILTLPLTVTVPVPMETSNSTNDQRYYQKSQNINNTLLNVKIQTQIVNKRNKTIFPKELILKFKELGKRNLDNLYPYLWSSTVEKKSFKLFKVSKHVVDSSPITNYYPQDSTLITACMGSTIPYGSYKIIDWIKREIYKRKHMKRPFYRDLRRKIYFEADSEQCHSPDFVTFRKYQECAIQRNQRMEFNVPKYPLHQKDS